ncbi:apolipoprotein N-acyltransferase [bacterium]|nr:apolipoprotein N-acyltransferase [bacterium]
MKLFPYILAALLTASAFHMPETAYSMFLGWAAVITFCFAVRSNLSLWGFFLFGVCTHALGMHWLTRTLVNFGGFPDAIGALLFTLYCLVSALPYLGAGIIYRYLLARSSLFWGILLGAAYFLAEVTSWRMFPWTFAHTQIIFTPFVSLVEFVPLELLSAVMIFVASRLVSLRRNEAESSRGLALTFGFFFGLLALGGMRSQAVQALIDKAPEVKVGLVQANIDAFTVNDASKREENLARYQSLSAEAVQAGAEVLFWPESSDLTFVPSSELILKNTKFDVYPEAEVPLIYGTLSYRERTTAEIEQKKSMSQIPFPADLEKEIKFASYNAVLARNSQGVVVGNYYKQGLMPFGEYLPFADYYPTVRKLSPLSGNFDRGESSRPIRIVLQGKELQIGALICYEDIVSSYSRKTVAAGANLLVNFTNDAWYDPSIASLQHQLLAQFRAIETRRFMLRVTNTGFTTVVDPHGRTVQLLQPLSSGHLVTAVKLVQ